MSTSLMVPSLVTDALTMTQLDRTRKVRKILSSHDCVDIDDRSTAGRGPVRRHVRAISFCVDSDAIGPEPKGPTM